MPMKNIQRISVTKETTITKEDVHVSNTGIEETAIPEK